MIELFTAKSGARSVKVDGVAMHSPYDPAREAARFVRESLGTDLPSTVIVLGECAGHVAAAAADLRPGALVIAAVYSGEIARALPLPGISAWHPGETVTFIEFLRSRLDELRVEGLRVLEWPPAARAFPEVSRAAREALRQVVLELNGSFVTTVTAGRTWLRNSIVNFLHAGPFVDGRLCAPARPVVITAPGPSLEDAAPLLAAFRPFYELWALPSSCPFLMEAGLRPDLVVMTDPGFYSMHHLQFAPPPCPVAMPLSAARGTWSLPAGNGGRGVPVFILEQPVLFEHALLEAAGVSAPVIPPHGTVAATAIDLALTATSGPVIVAGLDMAARDLAAHARPNAFDRLLHLESFRLRPHTSLAFHRAAAQGSAGDPRAPGLRITSALRTYAGWFDAERGTAVGRAYRLLPSAVEIASMSPLDGPGLSALLQGVSSTPRGSSLAPSASFPSADRRHRIVRRLLGEWRSEMAAARESLSRSPGAAGLATQPNALALAQFIAPRRMVDALKKSRLGQGAAAGDAAREMLTECMSFLDALGERAVG